MKRMIFAICGALALASCGAVTAPAAIPPSPSTLADKTVLDEQGALAAELAYKAARLAVETGVDAGVIKGANATRFAALDSKAFAALQTVRAAYRAGNATTYSAALTQARAAISDLLALTGKTGA